MVGVYGVFWEVVLAGMPLGPQDRLLSGCYNKFIHVSALSPIGLLYIILYYIIMFQFQGLMLFGTFILSRFQKERFHKVDANVSISVKST